MHRLSILMALLIAPASVLALATDQYGNKPIGPGWNFDAQLLDAVNVNARVYWFEVNGNPYFYFKGTPKELNEAIRLFAAIKHEKKEIILFSGRGTAKSKPSSRSGLGALSQFNCGCRPPPRVNTAVLPFSSKSPLHSPSPRYFSSDEFGERPTSHWSVPKCPQMSAPAKDV